ncbi:MAG: Trk family potassium uptake protein, partial [Oscillospiraceae bacterium]|nr:Trk family potassium uptake protein [Oscillospiraceae bacterium]
MKRRGRLSKTQIIALGFLTIVFLGTVLLMLPASSRDGKSAGLLTAAFTAVSSSCVTGLVLADTYVQWSLLGKIVILVLIQIGGLGFMTIAARFFLVLNRKLGLKGREILSESISTDHIGGIMKLTKRIVKYTAFFEGVGALLLMLRFCRQFGFWSGLFAAVFHSVSAFCNAGFDVLGRLEPYCSLVPYYNDVLVNVVIMILVVAGGLGFAVWNDFS